MAVTAAKVSPVGHNSTNSRQSATDYVVWLAYVLLGVLGTVGHVFKSGCAAGQLAFAGTNHRCVPALPVLQAQLWLHTSLSKAPRCIDVKMSVSDNKLVGLVLAASRRQPSDAD
jgi:hypothetical protein